MWSYQRLGTPPRDCQHCDPSGRPDRIHGRSGSSRELAYRTQTLTDNDLAVGQIRIPVSTPAKVLLPNDKEDVSIILRGVPLRARYDPRSEPRERSGVMSFRAKEAKEMRQLVKRGEVLRVSVESDGTIHIE
jgi:hypothetical protein